MCVATSKTRLADGIASRALDPLRSVQFSSVHFQFIFLRSLYSKFSSVLVVTLDARGYLAWTSLGIILFLRSLYSKFLLLFTCRRSWWFALGFFLLWLGQLADRFAFRVWCVGWEPRRSLGASVRADVRVCLAGSGRFYLECTVGGPVVYMGRDKNGQTKRSVRGSSVQFSSVHVVSYLAVGRSVQFSIQRLRVLGAKHVSNSSHKR